MGRAIDMENDIHKLKIKVETIENALEKVIETVDRLEAKSPSVKHVDLVEDSMRVESEMVSGDDPQPFKDEEKAAEEDKTLLSQLKSAKSSKNKK